MVKVLYFLLQNWHLRGTAHNICHESYECYKHTQERQQFVSLLVWSVCLKERHERGCAGENCSKDLPWYSVYRTPKILKETYRLTGLTIWRTSKNLSGTWRVFQTFMSCPNDKVCSKIFQEHMGYVRTPWMVLLIKQRNKRTFKRSSKKLKVN